MLRVNAVAERLVELLREEGKGARVQDARIGVRYTAVKLQDGRVGLAYTLLNEMRVGCTTITEAGSLRRRQALYLLEMLIKPGLSVHRSLGLATVNALLSRSHMNSSGEDTLNLLGLTGEDHVAMVGFFGPLIPKIKCTTDQLTIIEKDTMRDGIVSSEEGKRSLRSCSVALITATSILNNTLEDVLNSLGSPRWTTILGPSTPLAPEVFSGTPVNHLAGSRVKDSEKVLQIVSEAGGRGLLRPYLELINLIF
jgi:uncharacterized protein (DUF4213/DUF364 family)